MEKSWWRSTHLSLSSVAFCSSIDAEWRASDHSQASKTDFSVRTVPDCCKSCHVEKQLISLFFGKSLLWGHPEFQRIRETEWHVIYLRWQFGVARYESTKQFHNMLPEHVHIRKTYRCRQLHSLVHSNIQKSHGWNNFGQLQSAGPACSIGVGKIPRQDMPVATKDFRRF